MKYAIFFVLYKIRNVLPSKLRDGACRPGHNDRSLSFPREGIEFVYSNSEGVCLYAYNFFLMCSVQWLSCLEVKY